MSHDDDDRYLWDRSGPPDPTIARLEAALRPLRHERPLARPRRAVPIAFGLTLVLAAAAAALIFTRSHASPCDTPSAFSFHVEGAGAARCGSSARTAGFLPTDGLLETTTSPASLRVAALGTVALAPGSRLRLVSARDATPKLSLEYGSLHAKIDAPPRLFVVQAANTDAVDLGCEYELDVDDHGGGRLAVSFGSVSLERPGRAPTLVTEHTSCRIGARGPGTPVADDAGGEVRRFADALDAGDGSAVDRLLDAAGDGDTITLWHLMRRVDPDERGRAWDRLARFVPPPASAPRDAVVRGERGAIAAYKEALLPRWFRR